MAKEEVKETEVEINDPISQTQVRETSYNNDELTNMLRQSLAQNQQVQAQQQQPSSSGRLSMQDLFPTLTQPIQLGSYSGSQVGNVPIYGSAGIVPYNIYRDNVAKQQEADAALAMKRSKFDLPDIYQLKDQQYQREFNNAAFQTINDFKEEAKTIHGKDYLIALQDPSTEIGSEFARSMANYNALGGSFDELSDRVNQIEGDYETEGGTYHSPLARKIAREAKNAIGTFASGDVRDVDIPKTLGMLQGVMNLDDYLQDKIYPDLERQVIQTIGSPQNKGDYDAFYSKKRTFVDNQAEQIAERLTGPSGIYEGHEFITKDVIKDAIMSNYSEQVERDVTTVKHHAPKSGWGGLSFKEKEDALAQREINLQGGAYGLKWEGDPKTGEWVDMTIEEVNKHLGNYSNGRLGNMDVSSVNLKKKKDGKEYLTIEGVVTSPGGKKTKRFEDVLWKSDEAYNALSAMANEKKGNITLNEEERRYLQEGSTSPYSLTVDEEGIIVRMDDLSEGNAESSMEKYKEEKAAKTKSASDAILQSLPGVGSLMSKSKKNTTKPSSKSDNNVSSGGNTQPKKSSGLGITQ